MSVKFEVNGEVMVAYLSGDIDHHTARPIREQIDDEADKNMPSLLVLDFKDVSFMDSSGIGLVMGRYRLLSPRGCELAVTNPSPQIYKVMNLAGLGRLAKIEKGDIKDDTAK